MWAMIVKEFRQLRRDRRTLAMMIVLPVLLLVVLGYAASFDVKTISVVASGPQASAVAARLTSPFEVTTTGAGVRPDLGAGPAAGRQGRDGRRHRRRQAAGADRRQPAVLGQAALAALAGLEQRHGRRQRRARRRVGRRR